MCLIWGLFLVRGLRSETYDCAFLANARRTCGEVPPLPSVVVSQLVPGSVGNMDLITRLIEKTVPLMKMPDSSTPEMHGAYLRVQRMARYDACSKTERLDRHVRAVILSLCPRKSDRSAAVSSAELKRQKDSCDKRAADCLELGEGAEGPSCLVQRG